MPTTTNYGWTTPADTDLVKDGAAAIRTLGSSIDSTLKTQIDAQIPDTLLTTTGDVIYASGANTPARLGIGSTGQVLTVSGGVPAWSTVSTGSLTLISRVVPSASTGFSFTSIPSTYTELVLKWRGLYLSAAATIFNIRFNNDSASNYSGTNVRSNNAGSPTDATAASAGTGMVENNNTVQTNTASQGIIRIGNYTNTSYWKDFTYDAYNYDAGAQRTLNIMNWRSLSVLSSIDIVRTSGTATMNTLSGGFVELWGVK